MKRHTTFELKGLSLACIFLVSTFLPQHSHAICRDLVPTDAYYKSWKHCCDMDTTVPHSYWIHRTDKTQTRSYTGSCAYHGVQEVIKEPVCRNLAPGEKYYDQWRRCCDEGTGSRWWKRYSGDVEGTWYKEDCRHYEIYP